MKKFFMLMCASVMGICAMGQTFQKGDRMMNVGIGVGTIKDVAPTFTQKVGLEWGIAKIGKSGTLGLGFSVNNAYGGSTQQKVYGAFDYKYNISHYKYSKESKYGRWSMSMYDTSTGHRQGAGSADATLTREDLKLLLNISYHHGITKNLDAYVSVGAGPSLLNTMIGDFENYDGFEKKSRTNDINMKEQKTQYASVYSYDDLSHADFSAYKQHKVSYAIGACVGARYAFTDKLSAFCEVGLVSGAFKDGWPSGLDVFGVGASYKF